MVIAWVLLATTGILAARYYKYIFPDVKLCKIDFWFHIHRPLMILVPVISLISFIVILSQLNWNWVSSSSSIGLAHSIFGIFTITLSIIQPIMGFLRCGKDHKRRWIFNYSHRPIGLSTILFACNIEF